MCARLGDTLEPMPNCHSSYFRLHIHKHAHRFTLRLRSNIRKLFLTTLVFLLSDHYDEKKQVRGSSRASPDSQGIP